MDLSGWWRPRAKSDFKTMKQVVAELLVLAGVAFPYVDTYRVEPTETRWSEWTRSSHPGNTVSQTLTCDFDSLSYVELFAGPKGGG